MKKKITEPLSNTQKASAWPPALQKTKPQKLMEEEVTINASRTKQDYAIPAQSSSD